MLRVFFFNDVAPDDARVDDAQRDAGDDVQPCGGAQDDVLARLQNWLGQ
jgi:hypothetical protein